LLRLEMHGGAPKGAPLRFFAPARIRMVLEAHAALLFLLHVGSRGFGPRPHTRGGRRRAPAALDWPRRARGRHGDRRPPGNPWPAVDPARGAPGRETRDPRD